MPTPMKRARRWLGAASLPVLVGILGGSGVIPLNGSGTRAAGTSWQAVTAGNDGPIARSQYGMADDGEGHIYLYGGSPAVNASLNDFWAFDVESDDWQQLPNGVVPALVEPHLAVDSQGNVWEFGGIANPLYPHISVDGHSFGLYEYQPSLGAWRDATPDDAQPGVDWPAGREDFGFAFDSQAGNLVVFAGEGQDDAVLNDMWTYNEQTSIWTEVTQSYANSGGQIIAPRSIYNISADAAGHLYLFGGSFLTPPYGVGTSAYSNDLWRYDDQDQTWTLLAGVPNGFDPQSPLPRHYYGQTVDSYGDFDILGGYLYAPEATPFFQGTQYGNYARPFAFADGNIPGTYGLSDFWQYDPISGWRDVSVDLGALSGSPQIPYMLVADAVTNQLFTFGGFHIGPDGLMEPSDALWSLDERVALLPAPPETATATPSASPSQTVTALPTATPTSTMPASPTPTAIRPATPAPKAGAARSGTPTTKAAAIRPAPAAPSQTPITRTAGAIASMEPLTGTTIVKTTVSGPYKLVLKIGPPEKIFTVDQARRLHPKAGEIAIIGTAPTSDAITANHYLALYLYSRATGASVSNVKLSLSIILPNGTARREPAGIVMQRIGSGPADRHYGANVSLPNGPYRVVVQVEEPSSSFAFT